MELFEGGISIKRIILIYSICICFIFTLASCSADVPEPDTKTNPDTALGLRRRAQNKMINCVAVVIKLR